MSATAKNLERITAAMVQHDRNCEAPLVAVEMSPFEVERLGWDTIRGVSVEANDQLGTGRFNLVCEQDLLGAPRVDEREAVAA